MTEKSRHDSFKLKAKLFPFGFAFFVACQRLGAVSVRHGESEQTDGFLCVVHLLDEALGLGQNGLSAR